MDKTEHETLVSDLLNVLLKYQIATAQTSKIEKNGIYKKPNNDLSNVKYPMIAVIGKNKSGKTFLLQNLNQTYQIHGQTVQFYVVSYEFYEHFLSKAIMIIYIINSYGLSEQKVIEKMYKLKTKASQLVVVFNFHMIQTLTIGRHFERKVKEINRIHRTIQGKLILVYADNIKANLSYYMLYYQMENKLLFDHLNELIAHTLDKASLLTNNSVIEKVIETKYQPVFRYYEDKINQQFVIEIELCGEIKDVKLTMKQIKNSIQFTISGEKNQAIIDNRINENNIPFQIQFLVPYELATIIRLDSLEKFEYDNGIARFSIDLLNKRDIRISANETPKK